MSFSRISEIINEYEGINSEKKVPVSKETKALKLFTNGKDLVYVVTKLDMKPEDVRKLYLEYQSLQGLPSLKDMHNEIGNSLPSFVQAYKKIVRSGIGIDKVSQNCGNSRRRYHILKISTMSYAMNVQKTFSAEVWSYW